MGTLPVICRLMRTKCEKDNMKKSRYVVAAFAAVAIVAPTVASADTVVIEHRDHWRGARAEFREHRDYGWQHGWCRDHDRDRGGLVIKEHGDRY
jgi:hypothetical protein